MDDDDGVMVLCVRGVRVFEGEGVGVIVVRFGKCWMYLYGNGLKMSYLIGTVKC